MCLSASALSTRKTRNESRDLHKRNAHQERQISAPRLSWRTPSAGMLKCRYKNVNMSGESGCFFLAMVIRRDANTANRWIFEHFGPSSAAEALWTPHWAFRIIDANYLAPCNTRKKPHPPRCIRFGGRVWEFGQFPHYWLAAAPRSMKKLHHRRSWRRNIHD